MQPQHVPLPGNRAQLAGRPADHHAKVRVGRGRKVAADRAGLHATGQSAHTLRHSFATHLLESGGRPPHDPAACSAMPRCGIRCCTSTSHGSHLASGGEPARGAGDSRAGDRATHRGGCTSGDAATLRGGRHRAPTRRSFLGDAPAWVTGQHRRVLRRRSRSAARRHWAGIVIAVSNARTRSSRTTAAANRHCPKCLTAARNAWVAAREQELLPVGYVHIVFTMPEPLARLALANKRVVYDLLFQAAAETRTPGRGEPEAPGGRRGRADGPAHVGPATPASSPRPRRRADGRRVARTGPGGSTPGPRFFLPIPGAAAGLSGQARRRSPDGVSPGPPLLSPASSAPLTTEQAFGTFLRSLYRQAWVVYAKPPFGSPAHVLHYLARYTHRVAISNHRLVDVTNDHRLVSVEGLSPRQSDAHAHARRRRVSSPLSPPRPAEALRPHPVLRLPRFAHADAAGWLVVAGSCRASAPPPLDAPLVTPPRRASWPCPRCGAPMRLIERLTARQLLLDALLAEHSSMTPRERRVRLAIRLLTRRHARTPEVYPNAGSADRAAGQRRRGEPRPPHDHDPVRGCTPARQGLARLKGHS